MEAGRVVVIERIRVIRKDAQGRYLGTRLVEPDGTVKELHDADDERRCGTDRNAAGS